MKKINLIGLFLFVTMAIYSQILAVLRAVSHLTLTVLLVVVVAVQIGKLKISWFFMIYKLPLCKRF